MADLPRRRTAVIVATDLVGSTVRRSEMGEAAADAWRRRHDEILGRAIGQHGGHVIKGLGDGLLAGFHAASDAVMACVAIQRAASFYGHRHPDQLLDIRIGISGGDVSYEDGDCFGIPVIEAVRLCEVARGGQILLVDLVRRMARGRAGHRFVEVGPLALKGLPEPVDAWETVWERSPGDEAVPLPAVVAAAERFPFAGRAVPYTTLRSRYQAAADGALQIVLIGGEPGIGKTRLALEMAREAHRDGATVLFGRADEDVHVAFCCVSEALTQLVRHVDSPTLEEHVRHHGDRLSRLVPSLELRIPDLPPARPHEDERMAMLEAAVDLLALASTGGPVVVVLDDLQWADAASLRLLHNLGRHAPAMAVLLIGTYRDTEVPPSHPLATILSDLRPAANVGRIELQGLRVAEVAEFLTRMATVEPGDAADAIAEAVHRETAGNPFFVGEVLDHLAHSGVVFRQQVRSGRAPLEPIGVPAGVREVIETRISGLSFEAGRALLTASAISTEFDVSILAGVLDRPVPDVIDLLAEPIARGLLRETGLLDRYRFSHGLVRQALYETLADSRRVRLHLEVADAMAATGRGSDAELAHHLCESAAVGDPRRAAAAAQRVGAAAMDVLAYEQAVHWYERALACGAADQLDDDAQHGGILVALARALKSAEEPEGARARLLEAATLARAIHDVELLCDAAVEFGGGRWRDSDDATGLALIDEALAALGHGDDTRQAELLLRRCEWQYFDPDPAERLDVAARAIVLATAAADDHLHLRALITRWEALRGLPEASEELAALGPAMLGRWRELGCPPALASAVHGAIAAAALQGDLRRFGSCVEELADHAVRWRLDTELFEVHALRACLAIFAGRLDDAERHMKLGADHIPPDWGVGTLINGRQRAWLARERGDLGAERRILAEVSRGPMVAMTDLLDARGAYEAEQLGMGDELVRRWVRETLPRTPRWLIGHYLGMHSYWASTLGTGSAAALYDILRPFRGQWLAARVELVHGSADLHLGRYARGAGPVDQAAEHLDDAIAAHDLAGEVTLRTHAVVELGEILEARGRPGDRDRARTLADQAQADADRIGLGGVAAAAQALLGRLDGPSRSA